MHKWNGFLASCFALVIFLGVISSHSLAGEIAQPKIGEIAPAFILESLQGGEVSLADLAAKHVVIHFATSW